MPKGNYKISDIGCRVVKVDAKSSTAAGETVELELINPEAQEAFVQEIFAAFADDDKKLENDPLPRGKKR